MSARARDPALWGVVPAAGAGRRMQSTTPKQYLSLEGRPVLVHTLERLAILPGLEGIVVAMAPDDPWWAELEVEIAVPVYTVTGGAERCHSVAAALEHLAGMAAGSDWVLVHDAARPCVRPADLERLVWTLGRDPVGGLLAVPVRDTMKRGDNEGRVAATVDRDNLWHALTPQMFRLEALRGALAAAIAAGELVTDEAAAMERAGMAPRLVAGHADNIKITLPEDLALAAFFLRRQDQERLAQQTGLDDGG